MQRYPASDAAHAAGGGSALVRLSPRWQLGVAAAPGGGGAHVSFVNGVATAFNNEAIVTLDSYAVPVLEALCAATGTCAAARRAIAALDCAAKHALSDKPVCKTYHYIDGVVVSSSAEAEAAAFAVALLAVAGGAAALAARK